MLADSAVPLQGTNLAMSSLNICDPIENCNDAKPKPSFLDLPNEVSSTMFSVNVATSNTDSI